MAEALEGGTETAFGAARAFGHTAETSGAAAEKTYDAVGFAEWIALKNDGLGFVDWHELSARRPTLPFFDGGSGSRGTFTLRIGVNWNENFYHTYARGANGNAGGQRPNLISLSWTELGIHRGGAAGSRWQPPNLFGGGAL